jgi:dTDP-4-amino-4,6-dideoxygalactose transaminase
MNIPLVDLKKQYLNINEEINFAIQSVLNDTAFILGKYTKEFENNFANYCGVKYCVGVNSGTDALFLSFLAIGLKAGDEIITVPNTFFATTEYLVHIGAKPVFVDIDPDTYLIDVNKIENAVTARTKAIIPVHLGGQIVDMEKIMYIAKKYKLKVIEDCAQAHGAEYKGKKAGNFGDVGIYSFYPGKNLGAYGDAGCIITNDEKIADFIRMYRDHGRINKYEHKHEAYSSRMDGIQAAVLNVKLKYLDQWVEKRRSVAKKYNELLSNKIKKPVESSENKHAYHLYMISVERRDELKHYLELKGIEAGVHYPIPLHLQPAYKYLNITSGSLPVAEELAKHELSLPIFPELADEEIEYIANCVNDFFE